MIRAAVAQGHVRFRLAIQRARPSLLALGFLAGFGQAAAETSQPAADAADRAALQRREARGWLELDVDQRAYRDRVSPLDLKQQRRLETIERSQRIDLRAMQQRNQRDLERVERQRRLRQTPGSIRTPTIPARDNAADIRLRAERHRLNIRSQQDALPFKRR